MTAAPVAVLFLGETLLIPHLWPIVEALAGVAPELAIDCIVATSLHEALLRDWAAPHPGVRIVRAPGFRQVDGEPGDNPPLPPKLLTLARLAPRLSRTGVVVCAEQTSLWLPRALPFLSTRFVKTSHGVGSMSARDDPRRRAAWRMLVPSERERRTYLERGFAAERVLATGYVKASFVHRTPPTRLFADDKPILLYTPHWQRHRSSWWEWGRAVVDALVAQDRWNVILAPHQRLVERAPEVRQVLAAAAGARHVHADLDSFATVDGSYTAAADLYLGDTSSQVIEFLARPRPCVFLNPQRAAWVSDPSYAMWGAGEVVAVLDDLPAALDRAILDHDRYRPFQTMFAGDSLGDTSGAAPRAAASVILDALA